MDLAGWTLPENKVTDISQLPNELNAYIEFIENALEVPVIIVSVGPDRKETLMRHTELAI
jgi:adenylosuccinate synthase